MRTLISIFFALIFLIIFPGCAGIYKPINPSTINYAFVDQEDGVAISYKYDVLREKGNKKYAKKEYKKGIKLIAVKITNNTDNVINVGKDLAFFSGQKQMSLMDPMTIKETIKQIVPGYLPYLLLSLTTLNITKGTITDSYRIGLLIGPGLAIGNMSVAGTSNKNLLNELTEYNLINKEIQKGETVFGIIGIKDTGYNEIRIKMLN